MLEPMELQCTDVGEGSPLVLIHGFPLDARMWAEQLAPLSRTRRVLAVDLRGHGQSQAAPTAPWSLETHADDIALTLASRDIARADIVGLSMGGYILFPLWQRHPALVRSLVLMATRAGEDDAAAKAGRQATAERLRREGMEGLATEMLTKLVAASAGADVRDAIARMIRETPPESAALDALAMRQRPDSTPVLGAIDVPTLVLHGAEDALIPPSTAEVAAKTLRDGSLEIVARAGHLLPLERPTEVNAALERFLSRVDAG